MKTGSSSRNTASTCSGQVDLDVGAGAGTSGQEPHRRVGHLLPDSSVTTVWSLRVAKSSHATPPISFLNAQTACWVPLPN